VGHHRYIVSIDVTVAEKPAPPPPAPAASPPAPTGIGDELADDVKSKVKALKPKKPSNQKEYEIADVKVTKVVVVP
jgi:hypothetical protein